MIFQFSTIRDQQHCWRFPFMRTFIFVDQNLISIKVKERTSCTFTKYKAVVRVFKKASPQATKFHLFQCGWMLNSRNSAAFRGFHLMIQQCTVDSKRRKTWCRHLLTARRLVESESDCTHIFHFRSARKLFP